MVYANENHLKLKTNYLFAEVAKRVSAFQKENPNADVIKLGIGDVTRPLPASCVEAMVKASCEMGNEKTFRGYPEYEGYQFLIQKIIENDYKAFGVDIENDEVFVSDGAKSDCANIQELFLNDSKIAVQDPVYPVYVDSNVMAGRTGDFEDGRWNNVVYLDCNKENNFVPTLPKEKVDLIYLCYPNNPTGAMITKNDLKKFVDYALENDAIVLYDAAYVAFITSKDAPHTIYEIPGAKQCAVEFKSFSKTAGFTGTRCAYCVIPKEIKVKDKNTNEDILLNKLWYRRQATKFNGVSYITQRGAEAIYSEKGKQEVRALISYYLENAKVIKQAFLDKGFEVFGGVDSPYIWVKTPNNMTSWEFFDYMLKKLNIVGTPGSGFGKEGEGYFRFTSFASKENTLKAADRILKHSF